MADSMRRGEALDEALKVINGDRQDRYGNPEDNFLLIARYWGTYLGRVLLPCDVANMMVLFKLARAQANGDRDSYVDLAGYCGLAADFTAGEGAE